jgi:hypothetical protein
MLVLVYARIRAYASRHVCIVFFPAQLIAMFKLSICSSYGWITQPQTCYWSQTFLVFSRGGGSCRYWEGGGVKCLESTAQKVQSRKHSPESTVQNAQFRKHSSESTVQKTQFIKHSLSTVQQTQFRKYSSENTVQKAQSRKHSQESTIQKAQFRKHSPESTV